MQPTSNAAIGDAGALECERICRGEHLAYSLYPAGHRCMRVITHERLRPPTSSTPTRTANSLGGEY
ncbi:MAG: hypothetical protein WDA71_00095 [Actinomycetota bacterium]